MGSVGVTKVDEGDPEAARPAEVQAPIGRCFSLSTGCSGGRAAKFRGLLGGMTMMAFSRPLQEETGQGLWPNSGQEKRLFFFQPRGQLPGGIMNACQSPGM